VKDLKQYDDIKRYWEDRAKRNPDSPQATTNDIYMREIETRKLIDTLYNLVQHIEDIADIGCGDGLTTISLAKEFPLVNFSGFDYSPAMLKIANNRKDIDKIANVSFNELDIVRGKIHTAYDVIYTTRCLINLPSQSMQEAALINIHNCLRNGGYYIMIENFIDGHDSFNELRRQYDLPEINIRDHNRYFDEDKLLTFIRNMFTVENIENISSVYYVVSRIIYSKICQLNSSTPNYYDIHHELSSKLPIMGNYGPIKMLILRNII
jgi:SAM-dependent methyltransferase